MKPHWRRNYDLKQNCHADDKETQYQNYKYRWAIAGILAFKIKPTKITLVCHS
tara:strand:+ start:249 stop:407 length:159 start_codon:yes stop_codon:yes gene_type:complete